MAVERFVQSNPPQKTFGSTLNELSNDV